jgi:hypothetical protein
VSDNQRDASDPSMLAIPKLRGWLHAGVAPLVTTGGIVLACLAPAGRATTRMRRTTNLKELSHPSAPSDDSTPWGDRR